MNSRHQCNQKTGLKERLRARAACEIEELELLIAHTVATLPDSLRARERLLEALAARVPRSHPCGPLLRQLQIHLQEHQRLQARWLEEASTTVQEQL